jgi:inner membrane protease subunit 2
MYPLIGLHLPTLVYIVQYYQQLSPVVQGRCWIEGDRDSSSSSGAREDSQHFGAVPLALIEGSLAYVCWPPSRWGPVEPRLPPGRVIAMGSFATAAYDDDDW